jgi:hypothetical protein
MPEIIAKTISLEQAMEITDKLYSRKESSIDIVYTQDQLCILRLINLRKLRGTYFADISYVAQHDDKDESILVTVSTNSKQMEVIQKIEIHLKNRLLIEIYRQWSIDLRKQ